jgi:hypothetical protein
MSLSDVASADGIVDPLTATTSVLRAMNEVSWSNHGQHLSCIFVEQATLRKR